MWEISSLTERLLVHFCRILVLVLNELCFWTSAIVWAPVFLLAPSVCVCVCVRARGPRFVCNSCVS
jgi:hypothetical protein